MSGLPQLPNQQTADFEQFAEYFRQLRSALRLHELEAFLDQELLTHGSPGIQLLFLDSNDRRPTGHEIVTGCIAQRMNDAGEIEQGYYAFYRDGFVEARKNFSESTNVQLAESWNEGVQLIIAELQNLIKSFAKISRESEQHLDSLLSDEEESSRFTDSERPTAHEVPNPSSKPPRT